MKDERYKAAIQRGFNIALLVDYITHNPSINPVPSASTEFIAYAISDRILFTGKGSECRVATYDDGRKQVLVQFEGLFLDAQHGIVPEPSNHVAWENPILEKQFSMAIYDNADNLPSMLSIKKLGSYTDADMVRGTACMQFAMKLYKQLEIETPDVFNVEKSKAVGLSTLVKGQILNCLLAAGLPVEPKVVGDLGLYEYQHVKKAIEGPRPDIGVMYLKSMLYQNDGTLNYNAAKSVLSEFTNFHKWPHLEVKINDLATLMIESNLDLEDIYHEFNTKCKQSQSWDVHEKNVQGHFSTSPFLEQYVELKRSYELQSALSQMIDNTEPMTKHNQDYEVSSEFTLSM